MKVVLNEHDRKEAYKMYVQEMLSIICDPEQLEVTLPSYSTDYATVTINKREKVADNPPANVE